MKNIIYASFLFCGVVISPLSSASIWSWIDSITQNSPNNYDYNFTIGDWDSDDSTPNPCYGQTACTIFIGHKHTASGTSGSGVVRAWSVSAYPFLSSSETMGELGTEFKKVFPMPYSGTTNHVGSVNYEECVGFFYAPGVNMGTSGATIDNKYLGYSIIPGSICGVAPAPSGSCDFDQDVITLDHGTLSRQELEGHQVSESVSISCSSSQILKIYVFSADNVQLRDDGSLYSELYLNDTTLGTAGLELDVEEQDSVSIKSVLRTNGNVEAGEFSGSTVMLITVE